MEASVFGLKKVNVEIKIVSVSFLGKNGVNNVGKFLLDKLFAESNTLQIYKAQFPSIIEKIEKMLIQATQDGAKILTGGKRHALGGTFFEPTLLLGGPDDTQLAQTLYPPELEHQAPCDDTNISLQH